jgi:hypothetical protein
VDVTVETEKQSQERLLQVLAAAEVKWFPGHYAFEELQVLDLADEFLAEALAMIRDDGKWSVLRRTDSHSTEKFCIFSCHFDPDIPNSGFVGWLASEFKKSLGTGVFVVCGQNSERGGIFDYWGLPVEMRGRAAQVLETLRSTSKS